MRFCFRMLAWIIILHGGTAGAADIMISSVTTVSPGDEFFVNVRTSSVSGLAGYFFRLGFGPELEVLTIENAGLTASWSAPTINITASSASAAAFSEVLSSGNGTLARVRFRVSESAVNGQVLPITFEQVQFNDGAIPTTPIGGSVTVSRIAIMYLDIASFAVTGTTLTVPVVVDDAAGTTGYLVRLHYDISVFSLIGVTSGDLPVASGWAPPVVNTSSGLVTASAFGATPLSGGGALLNLQFGVLPTAPPNVDTELLFLIADLNDGQIGVVAENANILIIDESGLPIKWKPLAIIVLIAFIWGLARLSVSPPVGRMGRSAP